MSLVIDNSGLIQESLGVGPDDSTILDRIFWEGIQ